MKYSDSIIKFVLSNHWEKIGSKEISRLISKNFGQRISPREVRKIISAYTLKHHGEPVLRSEWPPKGKS